MKLFQSYTKNYLRIMFVGLLLVASLNFVVDPQKIFSVVDIKGFNHEKPFINDEGMRKFKSIDFERGNYDTILLGTSRVLRGLSPLYPGFNSSQVYNLGLPGAQIDEILKAFEFANNNSNLKTVIIGLDFFAFDDKSKPKADYFESKFYPSYNRLMFFSSELFSREKFFRALETIKFNLTNQRDEYISHGFIIRDVFPKYNHRQLFAKRLKRTFYLHNLSPRLYDNRQKVKLLKEILNQRQDNTKLYLFISPIHAIHLETINILNHFSKYEQWKRDLVQVIAEDTVDNPNKQPIILWDFSGYNSITTEAIPPGGSKQKMKWYWESSHYKKELGDVVLDIMFNYPEKMKDAPSDFGVVINSENIESHLQRIRAEQVRYKQNFSQEVEELERLANENAHLGKAS